jgi:hypothetical protein
LLLETQKISPDLSVTPWTCATGLDGWSVAFKMTPARGRQKHHFWISCNDYIITNQAVIPAGTHALETLPPVNFFYCLSGEHFE